MSDAILGRHWREIERLWNRLKAMQQRGYSRQEALEAIKRETGASLWLAQC